MLPRILLAVALEGCSADVDIPPDKAYCEQVREGARIINVVRRNQPETMISMEKGTPQGDGILVGTAIDAATGGPDNTTLPSSTVAGEFRVDLKKKICTITTSADGKSATYRLKPPPAQK
jgi:hypothetical protein